MTYELNSQEIEKEIIPEEEKIKAGVCAAQWFVMNAAMTLDEALKTLNITHEQFNRYKDFPES